MSLADVDVVCMSHLRWNFVFQRPNHLMSRCARDHRVFYVEEPLLGDGPPRLELTHSPHGPWVVVPRVPPGLSEDARIQQVSRLLQELLAQQRVQDHMLWCYTPMALPYAKSLRPLLTVYDCMDELALFQGAPPQLQELERQLFQRAALVFTGGHALYEAKRAHHPRVHAFPSSVDLAHFHQARGGLPEPADMRGLGHPRLGYFGVLDERLDTAVLAALADADPSWQVVMVGPTVKVDPAVLPRRPNLHYLGLRSYQDLPHYLAHWDVALLPFAVNDATRFISPTKTLEYLAALKPVVSTPIRDVVTPYGQQGLVRIAGTPQEFVRAVRDLLAGQGVPPAQQVDAFLAGTSWDLTWQRMRHLVHQALQSALGRRSSETPRRHASGSAVPPV